MPNPRKSDNVHKLQGTYRPDRHGTPESKVVIDTPLGPPPDWLNDIAIKEWFRVTNLHKESGALMDNSYSTLASYCNLYSQQVKSPDTFSIAAHTQLCRYSRMFGLSPIDLDALRVVGNDKKKGSRFHLDGGK